MNTFMQNLKNETNFGYTENGATKRLSTNSMVLDMFALGGAYRNRSEDDCILLFKNAFAEDATLALKCLFYLGDCRGGQGERRFFRVCFHWFSENYPNHATELIEHIPTFRRWDDVLYATRGTRVQNAALSLIKHQLALDVESQTPSLLAKWLPSENASSEVTRKMGTIVREYLGMTHKQYRKTLSILRSRINIVEKLMSEGRWDEIEFDKIPSKAGLIYKNAFARRDIIAKKYETFAKDTTTTVNAATLYPYEIVEKALKCNNSETDRAMIEKYWENQIDVLEDKPCKMICVCDTSGSMHGTPINMAIGLSMYCAERIGGPFKDHYISFASRPQLIKIEGTDFVDKVRRIYRTNLVDDTNIKAAFDLLKQAALQSKPEDRPDTVCIISDMQINAMSVGSWDEKRTATEMERIRQDWAAAGLECPRLVYWNVDARSNTILDSGPLVSFVSGASPMTFKQVVTGKTGYDLMLEALSAPRYDIIK